MKKRVGAIIKAARERREESQACVAQRLRVSQQLVSRIERGEASLDRMIELCRGLGLPVKLQVGRQTLTLVHPIDPEERKEIEANLNWFARLTPAERLRVNDQHWQADQKLREAGRKAGLGR